MPRVICVIWSRFDETPSETALVWLATNHDPRLRTFADTAASVRSERTPAPSPG